MTQTAQASMTMNNFDFFSYDDVTKDREEGKDSRHSRFSIYDQKGNMIDFKAISKVSNTSTTLICVCDYDNFVPTIDELG